MSKWLLPLIVAASCGFPRPPDVKNQSVSIGGTVHGMWTGADGVTLRLTADDVDLTYPVAANGPFMFPVKLHEGVSYIVVITASPRMHSCTITAGATGIAPADGAIFVDVACKGPDASIALSAPAPWTFDPTAEIQPVLEASVLLQDVTLTVTNSDGLVTSARIAGMPATLGTPSAPQPLPLGMSSIDVDLAAEGGLTIRYKVVIDRGGGSIEQAAYAKASNTGRGDSFGQSVAISGDTLVVGAPGESSSATGVNGNQTDNSAPFAGAAYVFRRVGSAWMQEAYLKASNTAAGDNFGTSVAISGDTIAIGASGKVGGTGAVYVFQRISANWAQQAIITASNAETGDSFGRTVSLSGDTLATGSIYEDSRAIGINGNQGDNTAVDSGAVYIYVRTGITWIQQAYIKASNTDTEDRFGTSVALSEDTLAVGASAEASNSRGINNNQLDNSSFFSGAVYIFQRTGSIWTQQAYIKASNTTPLSQFGSAVVLSRNTLIAAAITELSNSTGINGDQNNINAYEAGAVYVFQRSGATWTQQAYIKASNTEAADTFGASIAFCDEILAVGAKTEDGGTVGLNGNQANNDAPDSGAVYVFRRIGTTWTQEAYLKASNTEMADYFGSSMAVSRDTLVVGAVGEDGGESGINHNQADNRAEDSGAVYVFR